MSWRLNMVPRNQDRAEVRVMAAVIAGLAIYHMLEPALYAAGVPTSVLAKVTVMSRHPNVMMTLMFGAAALVAPHLISLIFMPRLLNCRTPRLMACYGCLLAALLWFYFANLALPIDAGNLSYLYASRAVLDLFIAGVFAFSLNAQQIREMRHVPA